MIGEDSKKEEQELKIQKPDLIFDMETGEMKEADKKDMGSVPEDDSGSNSQNS